jgi:hypothetical protein
MRFRRTEVATSGYVTLTAKFDAGEWIRYSEEVINRSTDLSPWLMQVFVPTFYEVERKQFDTQGAYGGSPWIPLERKTEISKKSAIKYGRAVSMEMERFTDALYLSLTGHTGDSIRTIDPGGMQIRIGADPVSKDGFHYAAAQQMGTGNIPPREVLVEDWPDELMDQIGESMVWYVFENRYIYPVV